MNSDPNKILISQPDFLTPELSELSEVEAEPKRQQKICSNLSHSFVLMKAHPTSDLPAPS